MIPVVKSYTRRSSKGKRVNIPRHFRRKKTVTKIPVKAGNPSIKASSAEYDPVTKTASIAIVDEDKDAINFYMTEAPMKPTKIVIDEKGGLGIIVTSKGKKKDLTMAHIRQPKDF